MRTHALALMLLWVGTVPLRAQFPPAESILAVGPASEFELATALRVVPSDLEGAWVELTPLAGDAAPRLFDLGDLHQNDDLLRLTPRLPPGPALLCTCARHLGVRCAEVYLDRAPAADFVGPAEVEVEFAFGVPVWGTFLLGTIPLPGVQVSVVPDGLSAPRPLTLPLFLGGSSAAPVRQVVSDGAGRFVLPPLAEGSYFLEAVLPSGRIYRGDPFVLPALETLEVETAAGVGESPVWDLGFLDVAQGLILEVRVLDGENQPLANVRVSARQETSPTRPETYELTTDSQGIARLGGLGVEAPLFLAFEATGHRPVRQRHDLAPSLLTVFLEPLAAVEGEVLAFDGAAPPGAVVSLENLAVDPPPTSFPPPTVALPDTLPSAARPRTMAVDSTGFFALDALVAGRYRLLVTAPGFEVREREFELAPGEVMDLGPLLLAPGRAVAGRVVDAENEKGIVGAEVRMVEPPGGARVFSDSTGEFEFATASDRPVILRVTAEGYAGTSLELTPQRLVAKEPLLVALERAGWILAMVFDDATGSPCQGCPLVIRPGGIELLTNAQGEALSPSLAPGSYQVMRPAMTHLGSMVIEEPEASMRHAKVVRDDITVVRFEARQRALEVRFEPPVESGTRLLTRSRGGEEMVLPDATGKFALRSRPGEAYELFLQLYDPTTERESQIYQDTVLGPAPDKTTELTLPRRATEIFGRVLVDRKPLANIRVRLQTLTGATWAEVWTNAQGSFRAPHLRPGVYVLVVGERAVHFASLADRRRLDLGTFDVIAGSF